MRTARVVLEVQTGYYILQTFKLSLFYVFMLVHIEIWSCNSTVSFAGRPPLNQLVHVIDENN